jgi:hypothetical protein
VGGLIEARGAEGVKWALLPDSAAVRVNISIIGLST